MKHFFLVALALFTLASPKIVYAASVKPGDIITPDNASMVQDLVSPWHRRQSEGSGLGRIGFGRFCRFAPSKAFSRSARDRKSRAHA